MNFGGIPLHGGSSPTQNKDREGKREGGRERERGGEKVGESGRERSERPQEAQGPPAARPGAPSHGAGTGSTVMAGTPAHLPPSPYGVPAGRPRPGGTPLGRPEQNPAARGTAVFRQDPAYPTGLTPSGSHVQGSETLQNAGNSGKLYPLDLNL